MAYHNPHQHPPLLPQLAVNVNQQQQHPQMAGIVPQFGNNNNHNNNNVVVGNNNNNNNNNTNAHVPLPSTSRDRPPLNSCVTKLEPLHLSQKWKVENFNAVVKLSKPGTCLRSQVFRHHGFPEACWQLCLYPGGKREENANNVSLFLKMSATTPTKEVLLKAEYRFYFTDDGDAPRFSNVNIGDFHAKPPKGGHSWGLRNIPRQKVLNALREDGSLMILCEIELIPDVNKVKCLLEKPAAVCPSDMVKVPQLFVAGQRDLLREGTLSDCVLVVNNGVRNNNIINNNNNNVVSSVCSSSNLGVMGEQGLSCSTASLPMSTDDQPPTEFAAHKCVLAAHSQVFRAMFCHSNVREARESRVVIDDSFSPDAVSAMLEFVYTGALDPSDVEEHAEDLIGLSEKYALEHLKALCQDHLVASISKANVCQLLAISDMFGADTLKQAAVAFLATRKKDVMASQEWAELKRRNCRLATETLESLVVGDEFTSPPPQKRPRPGNAGAETDL